MAKRRRWVRPGIVLAGAVLVFLLGRGFGLWPTSAENGDGPPEPHTGAPPGAQVSSLAAAPGAEPAAQPGEGRESTGGARSREAPVSVDDPRLARVAAIRRALAEDRLGAASAAVDRLPDDAAEVADVRALAAQVQERIDAAGAAVAAHVRAGEVLQAETLLRPLLDPATERAARALARIADERGWPALGGSAEPAGPVPASRGLPRDRVVRARHGESMVRSRVVAQDGDAVTLRVVGRDGVTFPTLKIWTVEPEAVTAAEATELGLAALAAGEQLHARLWCAVGLSRTDRPGARLGELAELLR